MVVRAVVLAFLAGGIGCSTRSVKTRPPVEDGAGGTRGYDGGAGGANPGDGSVPDDGSVDHAGDGSVPGDGSIDHVGDASVPSDASVDHVGDAPVPSDASVDQVGDASVPSDTSVDHVGDGPVPADAAVCEGISSAYQEAVHVAQECTVGAENQCIVQVLAGFFCNCTTFTNGSADALAAIVTQFQAAGCQARCIGTCAQSKSLACLADTTSSTGGRCKPPGVLTLQAANNGGTFSVPAGEEVDITLESLAAGSYSTSVMLSSTDLASVLEVTIPAGPPGLNGPTRLYRVQVLSAGEVQIQIPFESDGTGSSMPAYTVTISAH